MKKFAFAILLFGFSGCSFEQDPYKNYSQEIREHKKPGEAKTDNEKPTPKDSMSLDVDDVYMLVESKELEFKISGRIAWPGAQFQIFVENLDSLPGAIFEGTTGIFKWSPPVGTVKAGYQRVVPLNVMMVSNTQPTFSVRKNVSLIVVRNVKQPKIIKVDLGNAKPSKSKVTSFTALVESLVEPRLVPVVINGNDDVTSFIYVESSRKIDADHWEFTLKFDLTRDSAPSSGSFQFGLQAFVPFAEASLPVGTSVDIYKLEAPSNERNPR